MRWTADGDAAVCWRQRKCGERAVTCRSSQQRGLPQVLKRTNCMRWRARLSSSGKRYLQNSYFVPINISISIIIKTIIIILSIVQKKTFNQRTNKNNNYCSNNSNNKSWVLLFLLFPCSLSSHLNKIREYERQHVFPVANQTNPRFWPSADSNWSGCEWVKNCIKAVQTNVFWQKILCHLCKLCTVTTLSSSQEWTWQD